MLSVYSPLPPLPGRFIVRVRLVTSSLIGAPVYAAFVAETDRVFDLLDGVMPEISWLDDSKHSPTCIPPFRRAATALVSLKCRFTLMLY